MNAAGRSREGPPLGVQATVAPFRVQSAVAALPALREQLVGPVDDQVLGAGGDRDPGKRPKMGAAAAEIADLVVVTDDNPRSEDPAAIRAAVRAGAEQAAGPDTRVEDLIRMLDAVGEGYRHGRHPDGKKAKPIAQVLRAVATELEL